MITNQRFLFRWIFIYFFLYQFPSFLGYIQPLSFVTNLTGSLYELLIPWLGEHVLLLDQKINIYRNGSGDTTYAYVLVLFWLVISFVGAIGWTLVERTKIDYSKLNYWLLVWLRFTLGIYLIQYGLIKVVKLQFPDLSFYRLTQTVGDMSPMGLAWTFIGYSSGYNLFIGLGELIGGALLLHRRTTLLGALVSLVVLVNIVAINMFFDVPVKLFSSHLLIMSGLIIAPNLSRLYAAVFNLPFSFSETWKMKFEQPILVMVGKVSLLVLILYPMVSGAIDGYYSRGQGAILSPIGGLYEVNLFVFNGDTLALESNTNKRWKSIAVNSLTSIQLMRSDNTSEYYQFECDTVQNKLVIKDKRNTTNLMNFDYSLTDSFLYLKGMHNTDSIFLRSKRKRKEDFLLLSRGFHWINEEPFNR